MIPQKDIKIMCELRKNARTSLVNISRKTGVPVSTIYDRIKVREKDVIKKHTCILDFPKMGYNIRVKMLLKIRNEPDFQKFLSENNNVNSAFRLNSNFTFMIDCIFKYISDMQGFTNQLTKFGIEKQRIYFISDEIIREQFLGGKDEI